MDVEGGLAPRADRLRLPLPILLKGERPIEQGRGFGLGLAAPALGRRRLLGHELGPGEWGATRPAKWSPTPMASCIMRYACSSANRSS